ncbi:DUF4397 domain-containing protein [Mucilaginibacter mali]|uniref:DUF4397 domain-containing protein n=1 Tax=Mucilaginibacter mali TaxID=2740462 RepID=A0A7D4TWS0_9SPHI|nr:DUF4397 domain-containing protein [Mucilaginibacter mali]QKJ31695.1 DUF4397 domain-containing protein [Mucilaginibacter mali]
MGIKNNNRVLSALVILMAVVMVIPMLSSCGKENAASLTGLNTQLNIINVGPDTYPLDLFIALRQQNTKHYTYANPSGYIYLASLATPLQIRNYKNETIFSKDTALRVNTRYSIFITGLLSDNTRTTIFVTDTDSAPGLGRGKLRFINASARTVNVDIYANGTLAFKNQGFKAVTTYQELPAGIYDLKVCQANTTTVLTDLPKTTIQDGRLYTLYTKGVVGRTDSAAFGSAMIINR